MDKREELGACLKELKGWGGLTVDLLAAVFINDEAARRAFQTLSTKARQSVSGRGVVVVYGILAHGVQPCNVAGIICPLLDTTTNMKWLGDTNAEGLKGGPILKVEDQNLDQFGWKSSLLTVYDFVVVQYTASPAVPPAQPASPTHFRGGAMAASMGEPIAKTASYTCGICGGPAHVGTVPRDPTPERLAAVALYCARCDDIVCVKCGAAKMQKGGAVPCGKCGGTTQSVDANSHPSWYPGTRPVARSSPQNKPIGPPTTTQTLTAFTKDLVQAAVEQRIEHPLVREGDLKQMIHILCRMVRSSPLIVGESTTVTRFVIDALARRISDGDVPAFLQQRKLLALDMPFLVAESTGWSDTMRRLGSLANEAAARKDVILMIEDLPSLFGIASHGAEVVASLLKRVLASDQVRCIIVVDKPEIATLLKEDSVVGRYFESLPVGPATREECLDELANRKGHYERFHAVVYEDSALAAAVDLTERAATGACFLDSAEGLLDQAGARTRMRLRTPLAPRQLEGKHDLMVGRVSGKDIYDTWVSGDRTV